MIYLCTSKKGKRMFVKTQTSAGREKKWIELGRNIIYIRDDFEELISN
jgi:hypothetical protein